MKIKLTCLREQDADRAHRDPASIPGQLYLVCPVLRLTE